MKLILSFSSFFLFSILYGQTKVDDTFDFQSDPAKKYSLYIPSSYIEGTPHKMMVGFHPFNTSRWDAVSWRDTLEVFSETNNLILVCPDGGLDGKVDDQIDVDFTAALIDSVKKWYSINSDRIYAMGFSWGGKTTYTYGLDNKDMFCGYIPIGAAISGTNEVNSTRQSNSEGKPVYIIHGDADSPNTRFYPARDALIDAGAIVETNLLSGVGHTIDFTNRNQILTDGFLWLEDKCENPPVTISVTEINKTNYFVHLDDQVINFVSSNLENVTIEIVSISGKLIHSKSYVFSENNSIDIEYSKLISGNIYIISMSNNNSMLDTHKFLKL